jgi:hypothetical protein
MITVLEVLAIVWAAVTAVLTVFLFVTLTTDKIGRRRTRREKDGESQAVRVELEAMHFDERVVMWSKRH